MFFQKCNTFSQLFSFDALHELQFEAHIIISLEDYAIGHYNYIIRSCWIFFRLVIIKYKAS